MESKILLESGNNELEVLEFKIDDHCYGINVAKIKEIIVYQEVTPVPNAHPSIEGIFMPRDTMITAIDLRNCLQRGASKPGGLFIITNFNKLNIALKESDETEYWLELLFLTEFIRQNEYDSLLADNRYITAVLTNIIKSSKGGESQ